MVTPSMKFAGTYLYTEVARDTVVVKCLAKKNNVMSLAVWPELNPGTLDPKTSSLTMRPPRLPLKHLEQKLVDTKKY